jgi:hypothetical protein
MHPTETGANSEERAAALNVQQLSRTKEHLFIHRGNVIVKAFLTCGAACSTIERLRMPGVIVVYPTKMSLRPAFQACMRASF